MNRLNLTLLLSTGLMTTAVLTSENSISQDNKNITKPMNTTITTGALDVTEKTTFCSTPASKIDESHTSG